MGPYKPLRTWVDEFIPYYMEIMGVDRPWHIWGNGFPPSFPNHPSENMLVKWEIFPNFRGENKTCLKPPPSYSRG